jgi:hypothetical protein
LIHGRRGLSGRGSGACAEPSAGLEPPTLLTIEGARRSAQRNVETLANTGHSPKSVSPFRQIATSLERLPAFMRPLLDRYRRCDASLWLSYGRNLSVRKPSGARSRPAEARVSADPRPNDAGPRESWVPGTAVYWPRPIRLSSEAVLVSSAPAASAGSRRRTSPWRRRMEEARRAVRRAGPRRCCAADCERDANDDGEEEAAVADHHRREGRRAEPGRYAQMTMPSTTQ